MLKKILEKVHQNKSEDINKRQKARELVGKIENSAKFLQKIAGTVWKSVNYFTKKAGE